MTTENRNNSALDSQARTGGGHVVIRARPMNTGDKDTRCEGRHGQAMLSRGLVIVIMYACW